MNQITWLTNEREQADQALHAAQRALVASSDKAAAKSECDYWGGYLDAINNVLNELHGPGDVN